MMTYSPEFELKRMLESVSNSYEDVKGALKWMAETQLVEKFEDTPREIMNALRHLRAAFDEIKILYDRYGVRVEAVPLSLTFDNKEVK